METIGGVGYFRLRPFIPRLGNLVGIHSVGEVERWIEVDVFEQCEVGAYRDVVLESIAPILDEA